VQLYAAVGKTMEEHVHMTPGTELDKIGYVNQHGLSRKVGIVSIRLLPRRAMFYDACICSTFSIL
jgi:hypothetical protein